MKGSSRLVHPVPLFILLALFLAGLIITFKDPSTELYLRGTTERTHFVVVWWNACLPLTFRVHSSRKLISLLGLMNGVVRYFCLPSCTRNHYFFIFHVIAMTFKRTFLIGAVGLNNWQNIDIVLTQFTCTQVVMVHDGTLWIEGFGRMSPNFWLP